MQGEQEAKAVQRENFPLPKKKVNRVSRESWTTNCLHYNGTLLSISLQAKKGGLLIMNYCWGGCRTEGSEEAETKRRKEGSGLGVQTRCTLLWGGIR